MTSKKFVKTFKEFLEKSDVDLGNNNVAKQKFIKQAIKKLSTFLSTSKPKKKTGALSSDTVLCLKPKRDPAQKTNTHVATLLDSQKADDLVRQRKERRENDGD